MVVVLPEPLTPTTRITCGRGKASISSGSATGARIFSSSSATTVAHRRLGERRARTSRSASRARTLAAVAGPRSEAISASSISSSVASSSAALVNRPVRLSPSRSEVLRKPRAACARTRALRSRGHSDQGAVRRRADDRALSTIAPTSRRRRPGPARNSRHGRSRPRARPAPAAGVPTRPCSHAALRRARRLAQRGGRAP